MPDFGCATFSSRLAEHGSFSCLAGDMSNFQSTMAGGRFSTSFVCSVAYDAPEYFDAADGMFITADGYRIEPKI